MTKQQPAEQQLAALVRESAQAVKGADASNPQSMQELVKTLKDLQVHLACSTRAKLAPLSDLALDMAARMSQPRPVDQQQLVPWIAELIEQIGRLIEVRLESEQRPKSDLGATKMRSLAPKGADLRLSLVDGQRLGEILVRMSYLRHNDLERALKVQKDKGCQLGEALVELKLLSREELDAALRVQKQRRNRAGDPWMSFEGDGTGG